MSRGLRVVGNGFSPVLLVKGDLNAAEIAGGELLAGADGNALRSALSAVGFAPEDFCGMAAVYGEAQARLPAPWAARFRLSFSARP